MISSARGRQRDHFYFMPNLAKILTKTNNWAQAHSLRNGAVLLVVILLFNRPLQAVKAEGVAVDPAVPVANIEQNASSAQSDAVQNSSSSVIVEQPKNVQDILLDVCKARGYDESCGRTLLGILWKESENIGKAVGDNGRAHGYFQIHYKLHKITLACAEDLHCSAEWTLQYLEQNGYPRNVVSAVQCHNGCGVNNGYAASAIRFGKRLWARPLAVLSK